MLGNSNVAMAIKITKLIKFSLLQIIKTQQKYNYMTHSI